MKRTVEILAMTAILVMMNIVGAGVTSIMGSWLQHRGFDTDPAAWTIILAVACWAAICFLEGAILHARRLHERIKP